MFDRWCASGNQRTAVLRQRVQETIGLPVPARDLPVHGGDVAVAVAGGNVTLVQDKVLAKVGTGRSPAPAKAYASGNTSSASGLWVYDFLAGVEGEDKRRMLARNQVKDAEPLLRTEDLLGGGLYAEYRTDDSRLTIELVKAAIRHGAVCLNYLEAVDFEYENGKITAAKCRDKFTGEAFFVSAKFIVSAAGPWVDKLRKKDNSLKGKHLFLSKGIHIVVAHERLPLRHSVYFDVPDGRMLFAIPRHRATYIGTTDTPFEGDPNQVFAETGDVEYLLDGANGIFPNVNLTKNDVESTWAGLRPLIFEEGKSVGEMSRKDEIFESESGLISIAGGKLTGYRKMAERIVNLVSKKLVAAGGKNFGLCKTTRIPLTANPFKNAREVAEFQHVVARKVKLLNLPEHYTPYLVESYGEVARHIIVKAAALELEPEIAVLKTELAYCLAKEMVIKPADFFERRTGRLYFDIQSIGRNLDPILEDFKTYFKWSDERLASEKQEMIDLMKNAKNF